MAIPKAYEPIPVPSLQHVGHAMPEYTEIKNPPLNKTASGT